MLKLTRIIFILIPLLTMLNGNVNAGWSKMDSGTISDTALWGIWGSSKNDVFAVGGYYDFNSWIFNSTILHYDGSAWSKMDSGTLIDTNLLGVWGSSATDVFTVGKYLDSENDSYNTTILHYEALCLAEEIYGENSEEVKMLRYFRDNVLNKNPIGQEIIKLYYQWSPDIVKAMEEDEECKKEFREMIGGILPMIK